jgi:hypothetical protein
MKKVLLLVFTIAFLVSCTSAPQRMPHVAIPAGYEEVGEGSCGKCGFLLFDVIPIGFYGMTQGAYDCAVAAKNGDALINPVVHNKWFYGFVGSGFCTEITGTVVKFK